MCILFTERRTGMKRMKYYGTTLMALLIAMCLAMSGIIFTASASKADEATDVTEEEFYDEEFEEEDEEEEDEDDYEIDEVVNFCASKIAKKSVTKNRRLSTFGFFNIPRLDILEFIINCLIR